MINLTHILFLVVTTLNCIQSSNSSTESDSSTRFNLSTPLNTTDPDYIGYFEPCLDNCSDKHQVCVDNKCQCHPQYTWNVSTRSCEYLSCNTSVDCQTYDSNRFCEFGFCRCNENTDQDIYNGFECLNKTCSSSNFCPTFNCLNGICECRAGFKMNNELGRCQRFNCSNSTECQTYDQNKFCDTDGTCKCKDTYHEDILDGFKCQLSSCYSINNCPGNNQVCYGEHCHCDESYSLSEMTGKCELNSCRNSTDCQLNDENSFCSKSVCKCKNNYLKSIIQDKLECLPSICSDDSNCPDVNALCVDSECQCKPNYLLSDISGKCELFSCQESYECQKYDENRHCYNGTCQCGSKMFVQSEKNGLKCEPISCLTRDDCSINNSVCIENKCDCAPNHYYNGSTQQCEYYECENTRQCKTSYDRRVCNSGQCVCMNGSKPDASNGDKCVKASTSYQNYCTEEIQCEEGSEKCVDYRCKCSPNHKYNWDIQKCMQFVCNNKINCTEYDLYRVCVNGQCVCDDNYVVNKEKGGLCTKRSATYQKNCYANYDCYEGNQRCVDSVCRCKPNYRWNSNSQSCVYFQCNKDLIYPCSGLSYDSHRYCDLFGGGCICDPSYEADTSNGDKCVFIFPTFPTVAYTTTTTTHDYSYIYYSVLVIFIASLVTGLYRIGRALGNSKRTSPPNSPPPYTP